MSAKQRSPKRYWPRGVAIIHEDRDILVVEKPPGLLTIGTDRIREETLYYKLTDYVRKGNPKSRERVFIVHRLDREASGILVFARSEQAKRILQDQWDEAEKKYLAIVQGQVTPKAGTITSYLAENQAHMVYSTTDVASGKLSHTAYRVLKERSALTLLEISLLTGRKHQIRVHLADKGHPIVGDRKYGSADESHKRIDSKSQQRVAPQAQSHKRFGDEAHKRLSPQAKSKNFGDESNKRVSPPAKSHKRLAPHAKRLALHAISLSFNHPFTVQRLTFQTEIPKYFTDLIGPVPQPSPLPRRRLDEARGTTGA